VSEFSFDLATPEDDAAIRQLLATNPVPGHITLTYEREPDYFLGCGTMGHFWQVLVARHRPTGAVAGIVCRATRPLFVNGQVEEVGYWSQLRVDERFRGRWLVAQGFQCLREMHEDGRARAYLATIIEEGREARGVLVERPRRHFPAFREVERLLTLAILLRKPKPVPPSPYQIERGSPEQVGEIVAFLREHGRAKQFFPAYTEADFVNSPLTRGFHAGDFLVAQQAGIIVGVVGLWDQSSYKQTVVQAYGGALGMARPLANVGIRLAGAQPLPAPGQPLRFAYASFICTAENDPESFRVLLRHVYNLAAERGFAFLMVGLAARDPLLEVARRYAHVPYRSTLYVAGWDDARDFYEQLDHRSPYVEVASL
jgi:hypothetical protein